MDEVKDLKYARNIFNNELLKSRYYNGRNELFYDMEFMVTLIDRLINIYETIGYDSGGALLDKASEFQRKLAKFNFEKVNIDGEDKYVVYSFHSNLLTNIYNVVREIEATEVMNFLEGEENEVK